MDKILKLDLDKLSKMKIQALATAGFLGFCFVAGKFFDVLKVCKD